jgi:hypothetical protein
MPPPVERKPGPTVVGIAVTTGVTVVLAGEHPAKTIVAIQHIAINFLYILRYLSSRSVLGFGR